MLRVPSLKDVSNNYWLPVAAFAVVALYLLRRRLLPTPIPGIPYNKNAARSILGDMPGLAKHAAKTGEPMDWFRQQAVNHDSPLCQVFVRPFAPPIVLLSDFREVQTMMLSRYKEFDRSRIFRDLLGDAGPHHHILKKTGPAWANQRRLLNDLMTPRFMHTVAAPHIYTAVNSLIRLWETKTRIANGRPFEVDHDAYYLALDAVVAFSYGASYEHRALLPQIQLLEYLEQTSVESLRKGGKGEAIKFQEARVHHALEDTLTMVKTAEVMQASVVPRFTWWWLSKTPKIRKAWRARDRFVAGQIKKAVDRMQESSDGGDGWLGNAVDLIVSRERQFARKEDREPEYITPVIIEEVFGFTMAGHESSSSTLLWALKYLTNSPEVQAKLRDLLHKSHPAAYSEKRPPTVEETIKARIHYLDCVMDEVLRLGSPIPFLARDAETDDATILGTKIPKGTIVFAHTLGPSMTSPKVSGIDNKLRHPASDGSKTGDWSPEDMALFRPERWLTANEKTGELEYNPNAGPFLSFGLGQRGCFGRRLGLFEFRISLTLLIWHFEFLPVPPALSGFEARDALTRRPKHAVVRTRKIVY